MRVEHDYLFKLLLVGDSGVGKSCLLMRFVDGKYPDVNSGFPPSTVGADHREKTIIIADERVKLQIWDTAGQERFRSIVSSYYRGAHGIFIVYDVTSRNSFDHVKEWIRDVDRFAAQDVCRVLIGNKSDMDRVISTQEGRELADSLGIPFLETSAKESANVERAFLTLVEESQLARAKRIKDKLDADDSSRVELKRSATEPLSKPFAGCC
ncbi:ras family-domain-containing protein [Fennellomyces sp. T-0311]|nr:ras family-domain-containing protein [Fennellomyces sp. T-0311]